VELQLHALVTFTPRTLYPRRKNTRYSSDGTPGGPK